MKSIFLFVSLFLIIGGGANESGLTGDQTIFETAAQLLQTKGATDDDETQILSFLQLQLMGQMLKKPSKLFK
ncbi:hypothetical protein HUG17_3900 [Dermatophagoides farinae]|uniref:Uncharacterized protein n=1 Tax=Dermatophagoides farinae TaxID=6954 RepID=A0A9D4NXL1_DERFA|nr:hypothetical protein HUG17_3900 [Dermatophagoides farinae]